MPVESDVEEAEGVGECAQGGIGAGGGGEDGGEAGEGAVDGREVLAERLPEVWCHGFSFSFR